MSQWTRTVLINAVEKSEVMKTEKIQIDLSVTKSL